MPFIRKSVDINNALMAVFNDRLGLPEGTLARLHLDSESSCSESRCIKNPPAREQAPDRQAIGAHTDFGSLVRKLFLLMEVPFADRVQ